MIDLWLLFLIIVVGLFLRCFFAVAELAVASVDVSRLETEAAEGDRTAARLAAFLVDRERILGATMTGSTIAIVAVATAFAMVLEQGFPTVSWVIPAIVLGLVLSLFGEILPRGWARPRAAELAGKLILPLKIFAFLFTPFLWLVTGASRLFARIFHNSAGLRSFVTRDELRDLLKDGAGEEIKPLERQMLSRVLDFSELTVEEVMVPLIEVHAISEEVPLREALAMIIDEGHSRLPVYSERIDNIVGVLYAFDVLYAEDLEARVKTEMRPGKYVPESISIDRVLADLQKSRMGMAIVVDEYGGAVGVISIEDILEQIVGDIEDEFDRHAHDLRRLGPNEYMVSARLRIEKLSQALEVSLPEGDYETVGGMLLAEMGRIPTVGETLVYGALVFTVRKATDRAITEVQVVKVPTPD